MNWEERFEAYAERKQREACAATLHPLVTIEDRSLGFDVQPIGSEWTNGLFDGRFYASRCTDRRAVNLVFVQSRDGNTVANDPGALGGGDTDKHVIYEGLSRVHVDAVMAGANTVLGGDVLFSLWHPELVRLRAALGMPRHPTQVVVSIQHAVTVRGELLFNVASIPAILITTDAEAADYAALADRRPWVDVIGTGPSIDMRRAFEIMARVHGIRTVSCVGGRTTAATLIQEGLVDDLYLTTSPRSGGTPDTPLYDGELRKMLVVRKRGTGPDTGVTFEHWKLR
jgi:riboflavin biosynthesis pyrimidine reductase